MPRVPMKVEIVGFANVIEEESGGEETAAGQALRKVLIGKLGIRGSIAGF